MSSYLLSPIDEKRGWGPFLFSLAHAEQAAADQCDFIADQMDRLARPDLARAYHHIGQDEREHILAVQDLCRDATSLPPRASAAYQGKLLSENPSLVERMAVFHLAFETSALSFLGYLYSRVEEHFHDQGWARQIRESFAGILRQEVGHVSQGKAMVLERLAQEDLLTRQTVARSLRRHHAFLTVGLKSFFKGTDECPFLHEMIQNYQRHFHLATQGVV